MNAFILSNFQFCAVVYHHCNVYDARRLEKLQKRVVKYVYKASYVDLLQIAGKKSLFAVRQAILVESIFLKYCITQCHRCHLTSLNV